MDSQKLAIVIEVDTKTGESSIARMNKGLDSMGQNAARAGHVAAGGIDHMSESMMGGMLKANLLTEAMNHGLEILKEWTIEAAREAAHTDKMEMSMGALAKAHGIHSEEAERSVEAIKKVGFTTQSAIHAVDRLMIANLDLAKAENAAKIAFNAATVENIPPAEALEKMMTAIESGASRGLRTMGIFVDLNKATAEAQRNAERHGKTLTENAIVELRYNAIVKASEGIMTAAAAAEHTAEMQSAALGRQVTELKDQVGKAFQGELIAAVGVLRNFTSYLLDNTSALGTFAHGALLAGAMLGAAGIAPTLAGIATAMAAFPALLASAPWAVLAAGVVAAGAILISEFQKLKAPFDTMDAQYNSWIAKQVTGAKTTADLTRVQDVLDKSFAASSIDAKTYAQATDMVYEAQQKLWGGLKGVGAKGLDFSKVHLANEKPTEEDDPAARAAREINAMKQSAEARKQLTAELAAAQESVYAASAQRHKSEAEAALHEVRSAKSEAIATTLTLQYKLAAAREYAAERAKISREEDAEITRRSTHVDEKTGVESRQAIPADQLRIIHGITAARIGALNEKFNQEQTAAAKEMWQAAFERDVKAMDQNYNKPLIDRLAAMRKVQEINADREAEKLTNARAAVDQEAAYELAKVDLITAHTLASQLAVQKKKTDIEATAARARTEIEEQEIDARAKHDIEVAYKDMIQRADFDPANLAMQAGAIRAKAQQEKDAADKARDAQISTGQVHQAAEGSRLVQEHYQKIFDSLKQQAGGVFDALLNKSQSVWSAIGNSLKTALLTAIKDVVTSRVAAMLLQMFTGVRTTGGGGILGGGGGQVFSGGGGGLLGGILGGLGGFATPPMFGNGGGGPPTTGFGMDQGLAAQMGMIGFGMGNGFGTTPGVPSAAGGGGAASTLGLAGSLAGLKGMFGKSGMFAQIGNLGKAFSTAHGGVNGAAGGAMLAGGGILAMDGLRRGGFLGMGEDMAGGALIGAKFGGPIGAAIGAGVGLIAGLIRLGIKGQVEKVKDKVRSLYQLTIDDKMAKQIIDIAKQSYGGNIDMAIRSKEVIDLLQLYAQATGKPFGMSNTVRSALMVEQGGRVYQGAGYENGSSYGLQSGLASLGSFDRTIASTPGSASPMAVMLSLDGRSSAAFLQGQTVNAISGNPNVVSSAAAAGFGSSYGRGQAATNLTSPGTLLR